MPETQVKDVTQVKKDKRSYRLVYRYTNRIGNAKGDPLQKCFWFEGNLQEARDRARKHCERMTYRYINCTAFIVDLDAQEKLRSENSDVDDEEL